MPDTDIIDTGTRATDSSDAALRRALLAIKDLRARAERAERAASEPIAIIGMACRFPAGANSPDEYWDMLKSGRHGIGTIPTDRWEHGAYFGAGDGEQLISTDQGGFIDQPVDEFDAAFFNIAPVEANDMDPQQRLLLEVTWEALEHAGIAADTLTGSSTGVFVGLSTFDYSHLMLREVAAADMGTYSGTGTAPSVAAGRLSFLLGLRGPSLTLDTACSSSLVSLAMATQSLRTGACRMALAGGVNLMLDPEAMASLSRLNVLSPTGRCHTFGADADGYVRGEGAGMVVVKRLSDALADCDRVLAVVRGAAVNHDGRSSGLTVPSGPAQREVIQRALAEAGLEPADVDAVEAHGTGTPLGDPIEVRALDAVYGQDRPADRPLLLGSVKTNIGHLEAAAGVAGVIKTVLALQHEHLPAHLFCDELSPHVDWDTARVEVNRAGRPWRRGERVRRAGISGFGWGGTNAHVILEEAPEDERIGDQRAAPVSAAPVMITLSARDRKALEALADATATTVEGGVELGDLAWTLQTGRARFRHRLAVTADDAAAAVARLRSADFTSPGLGTASGTASDRPRLAFVFSGQGAQLPGMGRGLYEREPVFRETVDACDDILASHLPVRLLDVLYRRPDMAGLVHDTRYTQPAMFALQCGLSALWRSWGIEPDVVAGHSIGEYAAAVAVGAVDLADAAAVIAARGSLMGDLPRGGRMEAVFADEATVARLVDAQRDSLAIAAVNGPTNVVVSGGGHAVERLLAELDAAGIGHRPLEVSHAFHSLLMSPMVEAFDTAVRSVALRKPAATFVSTVTGRVESTALTTPEYWRDQVLATVRFADAVGTMIAAGVEHVVELGPQPTLLGMIARMETGAGLHASLRSGSGGRGEPEQLLDCLGELWVSGIEPDWPAVTAGRRRRVSAPTYPFQRQRYWLPTSRASSRTPVGSHPLLGVTTTVPVLGATVHTVEVAADTPPWLADHRLAGTVVFPGAAFAEIAVAAAGDGHDVEWLALDEALVIVDDELVELQTIVDDTDDGRRVRITSLPPAPAAVGGRVRIHAMALLRPSTDEADLGQLDVTTPLLEQGAAVDVAALYDELADAGLEYGPSFRGIVQLVRRDGWALGRVELPGEGADARRYRLHPALLDACFHAIGAAVGRDMGGDMFVPVSMSEMRVRHAGVRSGWCEVELLDPLTEQSRSIAARIAVYDDDGALVASIGRLEARRTARSVWERSLGLLSPADHTYDIKWQGASRPEPARGGPTPWLVVGGAELATRVRSALAGAEPGAAVSWADGSDRSEIVAELDRLAAVVSGRPVGVVVVVDPDDGDGSPSERSQPRLGRTLSLAQLLGARPAGSVQLSIITRAAQSVGGEAPDVIASAVWGLARTVANEYPALMVRCIDLDPICGDDEAEELADELIAGAADPEIDDDIAFRGQRRLSARLSRVTGTNADECAMAPYGLELSERGSVDSISFHPLLRSAPPAGQIEIEVRATGLNFRDVLNVLGMYPGDPGPPGLECAGVVTAVGEGVERLAVGDEVVGIAPRAFDSHVTTIADLAVIKPPSITFAEAATLPIAYLTAAYGLVDLASLQPGESVLIHSAAGGVGMAAVSIAHRIGATVFATAGSDEKRRTLASLGVQHVYSSRTLDFAEQILADTDGRGVDVVLNSLSDDFIDQSFRVLTSEGRFLEIGKRGVWSPERAAAARPDAAYHVYELADFLAVDPAGVRANLQAVVDDVEAGVARPLPLRSFPAAQIVDAFRFMAQARHTGKVVITHRGHAPLIRRDGAYLVTGGLGGIGLAVAEWLVERGAGAVTLAGRSEPSADAEAVIARLRAGGGAIRTERADVSDADDVRRLVTAAALDAPLRGVFHAAGVLDDGALDQQTWKRFTTVLEPKLDGAELLHEATRVLDLDQFVLFSSVASVLGSPGQANYAAANAALDALAHRRSSEGLPAVSISWGAWADAGMAARLDERARRRMSERGMRMLTTGFAVDALEHAIALGRAHVTVALFDWTRLASGFGEDVPSLLSDLATGGGTHATTVDSTDRRPLAHDLAEAGPEQHHAVASAHVAREVGHVLGLAAGEVVDPDQDLTELGIDSLMAVDLANRLSASSGIALKSSAAFEHPTISALAMHLIESLGAIGQAGGESSVESPALASVAPGEVVEVTSAQQRVLFVQQFAGDAALFNLPLVVHLRGALDVEALDGAVRDLVDRHEPLRTNYVEVDGRWVLAVSDGDAVDLPFERRDARGLDAGQLDTLLRAEYARPFDMGRGAKVRALLVSIADGEHLFALTMHHIATDGWSFTCLLRDLVTLYNARVDGRPADLPPLPVRYTDYAVWQRSIEAAPDRRSALAFWADVLSGELPVLDLPTDRPRPPVQSYRAGSVRFDIDATTWDRLTEAARRAGATTFEFALSTFVATLSRWTGQSDIVVGTAAANRPQREFHDLVGMFVNTLPIRMQFDPSEAFSSLLRAVKDAARGAFAHDGVPFDRIVEALRLERDISRSIVQQASFVLVDLPAPDVEFAGIEAEVVEATSGSIEYDMSVRLTTHHDRVRGVIEFSADVLDEQTIERFVDHWLLLVSAAITAPDAAVRDLPMLPDGERALIDTWASGLHVEPQGSKLLHQLVLERAAQYPDRTAITCGGESLTFAELVDEARHLAWRLAIAGVAAGDRVGVAVERSVDMVTALLAVLESGAAFVPLDPQFPVDRLAFMVDDAGIEVVLGDGGITASQLGKPNLTVVDVANDGVESADRHPLPINASDSDVAYVIYTSGSTGRPKGVEVTHANVVNFVRSMLREPGMSSDDVLLAVTTLSFDISVLELFVPLAAGGCVAIATRDDVVDARRLKALLVSSGATTMQATPTTWTMLLDDGWEGDARLRVLCGGEAMPVELGRRLSTRCGALWNMFGPTETTIWSTIQRVDDACLSRTSVPIGRPIANTTCRILDATLRNAPIGVPGELFIGGAGVARGYLRRPELTAERFVVDPFGVGDTSRLYRTGDLARWLPDGSIEFLGRLDHQVKVRGHRIELGEVEAALSSHPAVRDVVAAAVGAGADVQLVAYTILRQPDEQPDPADLRAHLRSRLPEYMLPSRFVAVDSFPLTPNRKIDRAALAHARSELAEAVEHRAPSTPTEQQLAEIWSDVLDVPDVGVDDNFFHLGGHSILVTRVVSRVAASWGVDLELRSFFAAPTIAELARAIDAGAAGTASLEPIPSVDRSEPVPLSYAQQRMWFLDRLDTEKSALCIRVAVELRGALDAAVFRAALDQIYSRHDLLRTVYEVSSGTPRPVVLPIGSMPVLEVDVDGDESELERLLVEDKSRRFDLERQPPIHVTLVRVSDERHVFSLVVHHIASDGISLGLLFGELRDGYTALRAGRPSPLAPLPIQYDAYAAWQRSEGSVLFDRDLEYWLAQLGDLPQFEIPPDYQRPATRTFEGALVTAEVPAELRARLTALGHERSATLFAVLLAGFEVVAARHAGASDVVIGTPMAGRLRPELEPLIGPLLNTVVLRTDLSDGPTFAELVDRVRDVTIGASKHQQVPFELVLQTLNPPRDLSRTPLFQIMFNMLRFDASAVVGLDDIEAAVLAQDDAGSHFDMTMYATDIAGATELRLVYNSRLFDPAHMDRFFEQYLAVLEQVAADAHRPIDQLSLIAGDVEVLPDPTDTLDDAWHGSVPACVRSAAASAPESIAIVDGQSTVSYGDLWQRSAEVATTLLAHGVRRGDVVAITGHRSAPLVWAIVGTLASGASYVVVDLDQPTRRIADLVRIARPVGWIHLDEVREVAEDIEAAIDDVGVKVRVAVGAPHSWPSITDGDLQAVDQCVDAIVPDDPACLTFTSGTTGVPKAVVGRHGSLTHFLPWMSSAFEVTATDRFSLLSGLTHDPLQRDLFWPMWLGATIVVPDPASIPVPGYVARWIREHDVTVAHLTPAMGQVLTEALTVDPSGTTPSLRRVLFIGESLTRGLVARVERLAPSAQVINLYGTTETQRASGYYVIGAPESTPAGATPKEVLPLGVGMPGCQLLVRMPWGAPAAIGEVGEIVIRSPHLALRYHDDDELTARKFAADPAIGRHYRTGDLGRFRGDGVVEFLGRIDTQVQIRGFRVELGEIESALLRHPAVRDVAVVIRSDTGGEQLVAYPIFDELSDEPTVRELRSHLRNLLPEYMVPSRFVPVDSFPLTPNRKIDRSALSRVQIEPAEGMEHRLPSTPTERRLVEIWSELLGVADVGVDDNFFDLGGHSVLATRIISRVMAELGVDLELRAFFLAATVAELAAVIEETPTGPLILDPIPILDRGERLPVSFAQERMWFLDKLVSDPAVYAIPMASRLGGRLDLDVLSACVDDLAARHESLRSRFVADDDGALQVLIDPPPSGVLRVVDVSAQNDPLGQAMSEFHAMIHSPLDFARGGTFRAVAFRLAPDDHVVGVIVHHIIADGWSAAVIAADLNELYSARIEGRDPVLADIGPQFVDFAAWQRDKVQGPELRRQLDYWREHLDGLTPVQLPTDHPRPPLDTHTGGSFDWALPSALLSDVVAAARDANVSPFAYLLASFEAVLLRYGDEDDVAVGVPLAYRRRLDIEPVVGDFVNLLVIRATPEPDASFQALLEHVSEALHGAHAHPDMPFDALVAELTRSRDLSRDLSRAPLVQVMFNAHQPPRPADPLPGLSAEPMMIDRGAAQFDLSVLVVTTETMIEPMVRIEYKTDLFERETIERVVAQWQTLLGDAVTRPSTPWRSLRMLPPYESERIQSWSTSDIDALAGLALRDQRVDRLIDATCASRPAHVAIRFGAESLTYGELADRAERLARRLRRVGVRRGDRVGVALRRDHHMIEVLIALWKAGAAYVPLDPSFPSDRLSLMIDDAKLALVLANGPDVLPDDVEMHGAWLLDVTQDDNDDGDADTDEIEAAGPLDGTDVAYVIYTSGSTGRPKGVEIEHRAAVNFLLAMRSEPGLSTEDVLLAVTTLSFDISVLELFLPLVVGAQVVIAERDDSMDGLRLARLLESSGATVMQATPTTWTMMFELGWQGGAELRVLCGGEAMAPELARRLVGSGAEVWNMFGPTETTVWSTVFRVTDAVSGAGSIPIGHPIASTVCRILDRDGRPVPIGVPGELLIGGAGVARGYLDRPELTAERFIADPLAPGARLYRTGDLARWRADGEIEYLGRLDLQVKVRGFRIELGEVESALRAHHAVKDAVVVADGVSSNARLLGYVIAADPESPPSASELRRALHEHLPDYMVPARFMTIDEFPLTPNRKIDRQALPRPSESDRVSERPYVAPRSDVETVVANVFAGTLKLERVSVDENFFELGGHSLHATSVLAKLHSIFGVETGLRDFFLEPTAAHVAEVLTSDPDDRERVERVAAVQRRLDQMTPDQVREMLAARRPNGEDGRDG